MDLYSSNINLLAELEALNADVSSAIPSVLNSMPPWM